MVVSRRRRVNLQATSPEGKLTHTSHSLKWVKTLGKTFSPRHNHIVESKRSKNRKMEQRKEEAIRAITHRTRLFWRSIGLENQSTRVKWSSERMLT